jgi:hypothetical protein
MNYKTSLTNISLILLLAVSTSFADITVEIEGSPQGGEGVVDAPIYTLNGTAQASLFVGGSGGVEVEQGLTFSMDNVNSGNVRTTGSMHLYNNDEEEPWNAWFDANSLYVIKSYESLIQVTFNHKLNRDSDEVCLVCGQIADKAWITSKGYMTLLGDYTFIGQMAGSVVAYRSGRLIKNSRYNENFTQEFTNISVEDQGVWSASYTFSELAKGKLSGTGTIEVGPQDDPVDEVAQKVSGSKNAKTGIYSWTTTSTSKADAKVKVTIKHTDSLDLVDDGKNSVSAAAQTRKF